MTIAPVSYRWLLFLCLIGSHCFSTFKTKSNDTVFSAERHTECDSASLGSKRIWVVYWQGSLLDESHMKIIVVLDISFFLVYAVFNAGLRIKDNKIYGKKYTMSGLI